VLISKVQNSCVKQKGKNYLQKNLFHMGKNLGALIVARVMHLFEISAKLLFF
jgi:hypothetical protein